MFDNFAQRVTGEQFGEDPGEAETEQETDVGDRPYGTFNSGLPRGWLQGRKTVVPLVPGRGGLLSVRVTSSQPSTWIRSSELGHCQAFDPPNPPNSPHLQQGFLTAGQG